jgi:hypothetical protein
MAFVYIQLNLSHELLESVQVLLGYVRGMVTMSSVFRWCFLLLWVTDTSSYMGSFRRCMNYDQKHSIERLYASTVTSPVASPVSNIAVADTAFNDSAISNLIPNFTPNLSHMKDHD